MPEADHGKNISEFYAHSTLRADKSDWQLLSDHLISVGKIAAENASHFHASELAEVAGLLHDLGKYTAEFQQRLCGDSPRVDHATWGAKIAVEKYGNLGKLLAYGIAGHHAGLANGRDARERTSLKERLKKEYPILPVLLDAWKNEITLPSPSQIKPPDQFKPMQGRQFFQFSLFARMLFSCLVDADFIDTEHFYCKINEKQVSRGGYPALGLLQEQLNNHLKRFKADSPVNTIRADILSHVRTQASLSPGLFSLNVPTGGGKTLVSLAFALDHAIQHGLRRIIYVIPYTSIVEQNAAVFREALGEWGEASVLEHHSSFIDNPLKEPQAREKLNYAMENWDAPVIVTTAVQFFESLFADRPSRCRKLHNISNSIVILDEAQTLPLKMLHPCVAVIKELALNYRSSLIMCTATQPALQDKDGFRHGLQNVRELAPEPMRLQEKLKRVQLKHIGTQTDEELLDHLATHKQILCIVNNRRHARALFEGIADLPGACHLTTLMCAKHRAKVLTKVRALLKAGEPCRLVSTSLIEAGVDVDFPLVLRAEAGLDAIAQSAGRCNREGNYAPEKSHVLVFSTGSSWPIPVEIAQFAQAARSVFRKYPGDPLSLLALESYFRELYWQKGDKELGEGLLKLIEDGQLDNLPFETLAKEFRIIDTIMQPVIIPYDEEANGILTQLHYSERCRGFGRKLQPYIVQIPEQGLAALRQTGAVQAVNPENMISNLCS